MNQQECIWFKKGYCLVNKCEKDCDLEDLKYDKMSILNRINKEIGTMQRYYVMRVFKRKDDEIKDKLMGVIIMLKMLKKEFGFDVDKFLGEMKTTPMLKAKIRVFIEQDKKKRLA